MKKSLICFKKFNKIYYKRPNCISFLKDRDQIETTKKLDDQLNIFKRKHELKE